MKKEIRKENKIKRALKRLLGRGKSRKVIYDQNLKRKTQEIKMPRKIRRNRARTLIQKDGITRVNKSMKYYWRDIQAGLYKF